jgi:hypothetical protein
MNSISTAPPLLVHRGADKMARRAGQILDEPDFPTDRIYQWIDAGKIHGVFRIGTSIAITDDNLVASLTGTYK